MNQVTFDGQNGVYAHLVDKVVGSSYDTVRYVAENLEYIKHVSAHLEQIFIVAGSIEAIDILAQYIDELGILLTHIDEVLVVAEHIDEVSAVGANITPILEIHASLAQLQVLYQNLSDLLIVAENVDPIVAAGVNIDSIVLIANNLGELLGIYSNLPAILGLNPDFSTRAALVTYVSTHPATVQGRVYTAAGYQYVCLPGSTAITDLPGIIPMGLVSPEHFGAVADWNGTTGTDDSVAINAAFDYVVAKWGGGRVHLIGKYFVASMVTVPARCSLTGDMGTSIGTHTSVLVGAAALTPVVYMYGGSANSTTAIERIVITRAGIINVPNTAPFDPGTPVADDTVGILIQNTDQCRVVDVFLRGHGYCVDLDSQATGFRFQRVSTTHCHQAHYKLRRGAQISFLDCFLGHNGFADVPCNAYIEIDDPNTGVPPGSMLDTLSFIRCQFNQGGVNAKVQNAFYFKRYGFSNGMFKFTNCHLEGMDPNTSVIIKADPGVTIIREFMVDKLTTFLTSASTLNFFDIPSTTVLNLFVFDGSTTYNMNFPNNTTSDLRIGGYIGRNITIPDAARVVLTGMYCLANLTIGPATVMRLTGGGLYVNGPTVLSGVLSGQLHGNFTGGLTDTSTGTLELIASGFVAGAVPLVATRLNTQFMELKDGRSFKFWDITGMTDASGNAIVAHGSGPTTNTRVRHAQAFYKNVAGAAIPMTVNYIDGTNVSISNVAAVTRPFVISLILSSVIHSGW